jgi:HD-like signal output (HDOD) protein
MAKWFRSQRSESESSRLGQIEEYEVPSFPTAIHDVLQLIRAEESTNADIALGLETDPGMSVRVLRLVNSAGFGLRQAVEDVSQAVQLIGRSSLESILISAAVHDALPRRSREGFDAKAFWQLSAQRASTAGSLASELCPERRSLCWTAGLLQDLAIPLLVESEGPLYCSLLREWREGTQPLEVLEREALGCDHMEFARKICEQWNFPETLTVAIAGHHESDSESPRPERLVANLCSDPEADDGVPTGIEELVDATESLGLEKDVAIACVERGLAEAAPLASMLE